MSIDFQPPQSASANGMQPPADAPRAGVGAALRRYWPLVLAPVVMLTGAALALGLVRSPEYRAEAQLAVGKLDTSQPNALAGFSVATESLAETYSRSVRSSALVNPVARRLGVDPVRLTGAVSAAPIPETPVFRVQVRSDSSGQAVAAANGIAEQFARNTRAASGRQGSSAQLNRFRRAQLRASRFRREANRLAALAADGLRPPAPANRAEARAKTAELQSRALSIAYQNSSQASGGAAVAEVIEPAVGASSDRLRVLQLLGFAGLLAGLAVGTALALWRANRDLRKYAS